MTVVEFFGISSLKKGYYSWREILKRRSLSESRKGKKTTVVEFFRISSLKKGNYSWREILKKRSLSEAESGVAVLADSSSSFGGQRKAAKVVERCREGLFLGLPLRKSVSVCL